VSVIEVDVFQTAIIKSLETLSFVTSFQRTVCSSSSFHTACSYIPRCLAKIFIFSDTDRIFPGRGDRMKQAKVEAQELINGYRAEKQEEFNNMALSKGGSESGASAKLQAETNADIAKMQATFQANAQKAVDVLLSKCCEVSLEVPTARVRATQKLFGVETLM
jgi:ATP synthase subunit G